MCHYILTSILVLTALLIQIVLACMAGLEVGFSHDKCVEWAADPRNVVLFTERSQVCARLPNLLLIHRRSWSRFGLWFISN